MARALLAVAAVALGLGFLSPAHGAVPPIKQPSWVELNANQREILAPLASEWDELEYWRRKKWLGIAERYPAMKAEEQLRVQRRMAEWVKLSPEERKTAREKFKNLQKTTPEHKESIKQKWQQYKDLPEEEKRRLQAEAEAKAAKPKVTPKGRAPISGQKPPALPVPALAPVQTPVAPPPQPAPAPAAPSPSPGPVPAPVPGFPSPPSP